MVRFATAAVRMTPQRRAGRSRPSAGATESSADSSTYLAIAATFGSVRSRYASRGLTGRSAWNGSGSA